MQFIARMMIYIVIVCIILILFISFFLYFWKPFGRKPNQLEKEEYKKRTRQYYDNHFHNLDEFRIIRKNNYENHASSHKKPIPKSQLPVLKPSFIDHPQCQDFTMTWFGHTFLFIQIHGLNIFIDPFFSQRCSPVSFVGMKRFTDMPLDIDELPPIDIVIITHDHYDHLDYQTIKRINHKVKRFVVPLGVECHLEKWNIEKNKIHEMSWWEEINIHGLTIGCTPSHHFSRRSLNDQFSTLWASWILMDENYRLFISGDGGFASHFHRIQEKYEYFDVAFMECGQYDALWPDVHMLPEQSFQATQILNAKHVIPIHWGVFQLAHHPWDDSVVRMVKASQNHDIDIITPMLGETIFYDRIKNYTKRWYEDYE